MSLTQEEKAIIEYGREQGKTKEQSLAALGEYRSQVKTAGKKQGLISRIGSDIGEDFRGIGEDALNQFDKAGENIVNLGQEDNRSFGQKAISIGSEAFKRGGRFIGNTLLGGAKMFTTPEFEKSVGDVATNIGVSVAESRPAQVILGEYQKLSPEMQRGVREALGFAEGGAELIGAGKVTSGIRGGLELAGEAGKKVAPEVKRFVSGFKDTAGNVIDSTGKIVQPATDIASGFGRQATDFAKRTARGAQETAEQSRAIKQLPQSEANLVRTGANERVIGVIKQAPPEETSIYKELVQQARKKELDPTPNTAQPKVIAGREFMKPINHLIEQKNKIGSQLGELRKRLSDKKTINTNPQFRNFATYLREDLGLQIKEGKIKQGTGSIAQSDIKEIQKIYDELNSKTFASQKEIDEFLQRTFKEYDLRQAREKTFSDDVSTVAERARSEIRQAMPDDYNALAKQYAEILKPLQDTVKLLGYKGSLDDLTTKQLKAAEVALRVLGNAADRPQSVIDNVLQKAGDFGYESNVDLNRLIYVTDQLEDIYDITPSRGFSGSTARGIGQNSDIKALGDAATLNIGGLFDKITSSRASREEIKETFEAFINSL